MSKTITIPSDKGNPVFVTLNGVRYIYTAGETVSVPNEVAALFEDNVAEHVIFGRAVSEPLKNEGLYLGDDYIPVYTAADGSLRILKSDVQDSIKEPVGVTFAEDDGEIVADKTAAQIHAGISTGALVYGAYDGLTLHLKSYTVEEGVLTAAEFEGFTLTDELELTVITCALTDDAWTMSADAYELTAST